MSIATRFITEDDYQALHTAYGMILANEEYSTADGMMSLDLGHDLMHERLAVIEDRAFQAALREVIGDLQRDEDERRAYANNVLGGRASMKAGPYLDGATTVGRTRQRVEKILARETSCWCGAPKNKPEEDPQQSCSANLWHDTRRDLRAPAAP